MDALQAKFESEERRLAPKESARERKLETAWENASKAVRQASITRRALEWEATKERWRALPDLELDQEIEHPKREIKRETKIQAAARAKRIAALEAARIAADRAGLLERKAWRMALTLDSWIEYRQAEDDAERAEQATTADANEAREREFDIAANQMTEDWGIKRISKKKTPSKRQWKAAQEQLRRDGEAREKRLAAKRRAARARKALS